MYVKQDNLGNFNGDKNENTVRNIFVSSTDSSSVNG